MPRFTVVYKPDKQGVFDESNPYYMVSLITGPSHTMICVKLREQSPNQGELKFTTLNASKDTKPSGIDQLELKDAVKSGIEAANSKYGSNYDFSEVQYPVDDSPRYDQFKRCAYLLVERLAKGLEFEDLRFKPR